MARNDDHNAETYGANGVVEGRPDETADVGVDNQTSASRAELSQPVTAARWATNLAEDEPFWTAVSSSPMVSGGVA